MGENSVFSFGCFGKVSNNSEFQKGLSFAVGVLAETDDREHPWLSKISELKIWLNNCFHLKSRLLYITTLEGHKKLCWDQLFSVFRLSLHLVCLLFGTSSLHLS